MESIQASGIHLTLVAVEGRAAVGDARIVVFGRKAHKAVFFELKDIAIDVKVTVYQANQASQPRAR